MQTDARGFGTAWTRLNERLRRWLPLIPILLLAGLMRLTFFVGVARLDMFRYVEVSHHVLAGGSLFDKNVFFASSRLPLIAPLIASNALFGYGSHVSTLWPLLCSLASVAIVYALGWELFDGRVAWIAGVFMALAPLEVELGTQILPDPIEGVFVLLSVWLVVLAVKRDRFGWLYGIFSGFALGLAYFTRVNALVLLPGLLAVGLFVRPERWKRTLWLFAGLALCLAVFAVAFWALSGDPLVDWHRSGQTFAAYSSGGFRPRTTTFLRLFVAEPALQWVLPAFLVGLVGALLKRERARYLLLLWAVGFWVYLDVVSPLHGLDTSYRYAEPLAAPVILLAAAAVAGLLSSRRRWQDVAVYGALVVALGLTVPQTAKAAGHWAENRRYAWARQVAAYTSYRREPLYIDEGPKARWDPRGHKSMIVSINYFSGYRYDRDTIEPPGAAVNRKARLFSADEAPLPAKGRFFLLSATRPSSRFRVLSARPAPRGGDRLALYLVESP